jgi:hypothetical protein
MIGKNPSLIPTVADIGFTGVESFVKQLEQGYMSLSDLMSWMKLGHVGIEEVQQTMGDIALHGTSQMRQMLDRMMGQRGSPSLYIGQPPVLGTFGT